MWSRNKCLKNAEQKPRTVNNHVIKYLYNVYLHRKEHVSRYLILINPKISGAISMFHSLFFILFFFSFFGLQVHCLYREALGPQSPHLLIHKLFLPRMNAPQTKSDSLLRVFWKHENTKRKACLSLNFRNFHCWAWCYVLRIPNKGFVFSKDYAMGLCSYAKVTLQLVSSKDYSHFKQKTHKTGMKNLCSGHGIDCRVFYISIWWSDDV